MTLWNERKRLNCTLLNSDQLARNCYYLSSIIEMIEFLVINELPFGGSSHSINKVADGSSVIWFLSEKYNALSLTNTTIAKIMKTGLSTST